jgi:hypothetical protein
MGTARMVERGMKRKSIWLTSYQDEILMEEKLKTGEPLSIVMRRVLNQWIKARERAMDCIERRA